MIWTFLSLASCLLGSAPHICSEVCVLMISSLASCQIIQRDIRQVFLTIIWLISIDSDASSSVVLSFPTSAASYFPSPL